MKLYKTKNIIELLQFEHEENHDNYVGFEINESGNLVMVFKEHEPDLPDAVIEYELLESAGEW